MRPCPDDHSFIDRPLPHALLQGGAVQQSQPESDVNFRRRLGSRHVQGASEVLKKVAMSKPPRPFSIALFLQRQEVHRAPKVVCSMQQCRYYVVNRQCYF